MDFFSGLRLQMSKAHKHKCVLFFVSGLSLSRQNFVNYIWRLFVCFVSTWLRLVSSKNWYIFTVCSSLCFFFVYYFIIYLLLLFADGVYFYLFVHNMRACVRADPKWFLMTENQLVACEHYITCVGSCFFFSSLYIAIVFCWARCCRWWFYCWGQIYYIAYYSLLSASCSLSFLLVRPQRTYCFPIVGETATCTHCTMCIYMRNE